MQHQLAARIPIPPKYAGLRFPGFELLAESVISPGAGHLDMALTTYAKKFRNNDFIADFVAPAVPVGRQTDKYFKHARTGQQLLQKQLRAPGAPAERIRMSISDDSYDCVSHALAAELPDETRAKYADAGDLENDATQVLTELIQLGREDALAVMLTDSAQVTNYKTGGTDFPQFGDDASTPGPTLQIGFDKIVEAGVQPNFIACGWPVFAKLRWHPAIKKSLVASGRQVQLALSKEDLAAYFGVPNFWVGAAVKLDEADVSSFVWGKHLVVGYVSATPSLMDISGVKTFRWSGAPGTSGGIGIVKARSADPTAKSDIIGADDYYALKITAVETLYLFKDAVA